MVIAVHHHQRTIFGVEETVVEQPPMMEQTINLPESVTELATMNGRGQPFSYKKYVM